MAFAGLLRRLMKAEMTRALCRGLWGATSAIRDRLLRYVGVIQGLYVWVLEGSWDKHSETPELSPNSLRLASELWGCSGGVKGFPMGPCYQPLDPTLRSDPKPIDSTRLRDMEEALYEADSPQRIQVLKYDGIRPHKPLKLQSLGGIWPQKPLDFL